MAKNNIYISNTPLETKTPSKFAELDLRGKFLAVLDLVKNLQPISTSRNTVNKKEYAKFLDSIRTAVNNGNFDINEEGKLTLNLIGKENVAQAERLVKALDSQLITSVDDLADIEKLIKVIEINIESNRELTQYGKEVEAALEEVKSEVERFNTYIDQVEKLFIDTYKMDMADVKSKVEAYNSDLKEGQKPITTLEYVAMQVKQEAEKEQKLEVENKGLVPESGKKETLEKAVSKKKGKSSVWTKVWAGIATGVAGLSLLVNAGQAIRMENIKTDIVEAGGVLNLEDADILYNGAQIQLSDGTVVDLDIILNGDYQVKKDEKGNYQVYDKEGNLVGIDDLKDKIENLEQENTQLEGENSKLEGENAELKQENEELTEYKEAFQLVQEKLTSAGYTYIKGPNEIDLEGLVEDLAEGEYSPETQQAYDNFIATLSKYGYTIDDIMVDGVYNPDLIEESIAPILNTAITSLDTIVSLDGKIDDIFSTMNLTDEQGNPISLKSFETREDAYNYINDYINTCFEDAKAIAERLVEGNADVKNTQEALELIDSEITKIFDKIQENEENYNNTIDSLNQQISDLEEEIEVLKGKGDSQGSIEQEEENTNTNQSVSAGQDNENSSANDQEKNDGSHKENTDENEFGF